MGAFINGVMYDLKDPVQKKEYCRVYMIQYAIDRPDMIKKHGRIAYEKKCERMKVDEDYLNAVKLQSKMSYQKHKEAIKKRAYDKYHSDEAFRERNMEKARERYHKRTPEQKEIKKAKDRMVYAQIKNTPEQKEVVTAKNKMRNEQKKITPEQKEVVTEKNKRRNEQKKINPEQKEVMTSNNKMKKEQKRSAIIEEKMVVMFG